MTDASEEDVNRWFRRRLRRVHFLNVPAMVLISLGLFGYYTPGDAINLHPLLGERNVVYGMLAVGAMLVVIESVVLSRLVREVKARMRRLAR
jgi:hypothetical protein